MITVHYPASSSTAEKAQNEKKKKSLPLVLWHIFVLPHYPRCQQGEIPVSRHLSGERVFWKKVNDFGPREQIIPQLHVTVLDCAGGLSLFTWTSPVPEHQSSRRASDGLLTSGTDAEVWHP